LYCDGNRATNTTSADSTTTYFLYDYLGNPVAEEPYNTTTSAAAIASVNVFSADGGRERYSPSDGSAVQSYYVYDPQGSLAERAGKYVVDTAIYDGYGDETADLTSSTGGTIDRTESIGYGGQWGYYGDYEIAQRTHISQYSNTALQPYLLTFRYYDPSMGRFINRDTAGYSGGPNLYAAFDGNPVTEIDPEGTSPLSPAKQLLATKIGIFATVFQLALMAEDDPEAEEALAEDTYTALKEANKVKEIEPAVQEVRVETSVRGAQEETPKLAPHEGETAEEAVGGVYRLLNGEGVTMRTGRTTKLIERRAAHKREFPNLDFDILARTDSYNAQRGLEQKAYKNYGGVLNKIRPIRPLSKNTEEYMKAAEEYEAKHGPI
jgi:RHS repeat-associated protein